eukprot:47073_1
MRATPTGNAPCDTSQTNGRCVSESTIVESSACFNLPLPSSTQSNTVQIEIECVDVIIYVGSPCGIIPNPQVYLPNYTRSVSLGDIYAITYDSNMRSETYRVTFLDDLPLIVNDVNTDSFVVCLNASQCTPSTALQKLNSNWTGLIKCIVTMHPGMLFNMLTTSKSSSFSRV